MAADFWAGYLSGAVGIVVGNPLDLVKVRLQARGKKSAAIQARLRSTAAFASGTAAPILGYGGLNALLFVVYNRSEVTLNRLYTHQQQTHLAVTWLAGALGGLATWAISTPTELIKCRAQVSDSSPSSWTIARGTLRREGIRGLYLGGTVTALRDSIGYGFYFWSYELTSRHWPRTYFQGDSLHEDPSKSPSLGSEACKTLLCGGIAGVATWASVFPLDVIKTRVQIQMLEGSGSERQGAVQIARDTLKEGGLRALFRGLTVCSIRAFLVNAVQWTVYEWAMREMGHGRNIY